MKSSQSRSKSAFSLKSLRLDSFKEKPWWRLETAVVAGAIFCGIVSGILQQVSASARQRETERLFATTQVVVASKDLSAGAVINHDKIRVSDILQRNVTKNAVTERSLSMVLGRRLAIPLKEGDPILLSSILGDASATNIADKIPPGKRLFTLSVDDLATNNGFVKPNDHVDVMAHIKLPDRGPTTFTVLQDVTLVSVGHATILDESEGKGGSTVSFFADAVDTEMLAFAMERGTFSLSLRNPKDISTREAEKGLDINDFLDHRRINKASGGGKLTITEKGREIETRKN